VEQFSGHLRSFRKLCRAEQLARNAQRQMLALGLGNETAMKRKRHGSR
jgi:hypothetical protein